MTGYSTILMLLCAQVALAETCTTLTYVGAPLTGVSVTYSGQPGDSGIPIASPIIGTVTLAAPLAPNLKSATVVPASWDFSQELVGLDSTSFVCSYTEGHCSKFVFSTDAAGKIIGWDMSAQWADVDTDEAQLTFTSSSVTGDTVKSYIDDFQAPPSAQVGLAGNNSTPGTWLCPSQYTANNHTVPPPPPPTADPFAAEVAALRAQVATLSAEAKTLSASLEAANATIVALRAEIGKLENRPH